MSEEQPASFNSRTSPAEEELSNSDIEEDILDFERSPSPTIHTSSPEADDGAETYNVCDFKGNPTSPTLTICSPKFSTGIGGPYFKNEEERNDNPDQCSAAPTSQTAANPSKPVPSPEIMINLESLVIADSREIKTSLNSTIEACESDGYEKYEKWYADAPPSPVLQMHSPKVSFDASRSFCNDQSEIKEDSDTNVSPTYSLPVLSIRPLKFSYKASSPMTKTSLNRNTAPTNCIESDTASKRKNPEAVTSHRSPKVSFNPKSILLTNHPKTRTDETYVARPEPSIDSSSESSENPNPAAPPSTVSNACFDPSSFLENLSLCSSDDELQWAPSDNTSKNVSSLDQQALNSSLNKGVQSMENGGLGRPGGRLRGILKHKKNLSSSEKFVADCLKLLCKTANGDRHRVHELIRTSATEVFKNLCFDQFFRKGECFSSNCDDNHHYKSHIFSHSDEELWNASVYVICHAATPNLQIVENLIQHYTAKGNTIRTLLFAKCVARVKDADRLELAHFIVNKLSGTIPTRDVITFILMFNFSELSSMRYNMLIEGLGVFEQNTTHYNELMAFLNYHGHKMPARSLIKLIEDSLKYSCDDSMVESISGFLKRLHPSQKDEVQPIASDFEKRFGILPTTDNLIENQDSEGYEPQKKRSKIQTKSVNFAADPDIREFEVEDYPSEIQGETYLPEVDFSDEDCTDDAEPEIPNFYGSPDRSERLLRVFGKSCLNWILNGQCSSTECSLTHDFKGSLAGQSIEDVFLAADYVITQSETPSLEILKIFIEFLAESNETARVLRFRKCTLKMSTSNSLRLTKLVISFLAKQIGLWEAIEKVLVPNVVELDDPNEGKFFFDKELLCFIMSEAIKTKTSVLRCVTRAILQQITMLPPGNNEEMVRISSSYIQKFILTGREVQPFPDILPLKRVEPNSFASHLKVALYQGVPNKYFLAATMMKQAVSGNLRDQAIDILYTFLLSNFDRARVLTQLLENCRYFDANTKMSVGDLFGTVGLSVSIRLYENENFSGTAELMNVLKVFKLNIFTLLAQRGNITEFNLATVYCSVTVDTVHRSDTIHVFFTRCVDPYLKSAGSVCPPDLIKLTAKMFLVFTSALLVEESLELYKGIVFRQKSLVSPINIVQFVEPTLRCTFSRLCETKIRKESLKLYLDVIDSETSVTFQKVTHRSMFLIALMEITNASQTFEVKGRINIIHPLIKKMLLTCITEGVYFRINTPEIIIYSSMTANEIEVYMLWWFFLYVRARKREAIDYFNAVTVKLVQDCIQDDSRLPVHPSLRSVNVSITDCAERVASVIKNAIAEPISLMSSRDRGVFELHPATTRAMSQTACNIMLQHGYIHADVDRICTFCFDKLDVKLADKL